MKTLLIACVSLLVSANYARAAEPLTFRDNALGMNLETFKKQNAGTSIWVRDDRTKPFDFKTKHAKGYSEKQFPLCTDDRSGFPGDNGILVYGEVLCVVAVSSVNPTAMVMLNEYVSARFYFYKSHLWKIFIQAEPERYAAIAEALARKYGAPRSVEYEKYQNVFGAQWTAQNEAWQFDKQFVGVHEGGSNGLGNRTETMYVLYVDLANVPTASKPQALDF